MWKNRSDLKADFAWIDSTRVIEGYCTTVEGRNVKSVAKARVESLSHEAVRQRMLYTRKTRNGLWDSAARLEN